MNLTELERDTLQILLTNDLLLSVVRKVFRDIIEINRPEVNENDDNTRLGEKYRAYELSKGILEAGFKGLESYRVSLKNKDLVNRAR